MIIGIGMDIIKAEHFGRQRKAGHQAFFARLFTPAELDWCGAGDDPAGCFAACFAVKEAFFKALGTGLTGALSWQDLEVQNPGRPGHPALQIKGGTARLIESRQSCRCHVSFSHSSSPLAAAVVVLETTDEEVP